MQWYCIVFNPNCWKRVEFQLGEAGIHAFMPKMRKWASHARQRVAKDYPLLGRYMFVRCKPEDFWKIRAMHGVESFVCALGRPTAFPNKWVNKFFRRWLLGEWDFVRQSPVHGADEQGKWTMRVNAPYPVGARVSIIEGEFAEVMATVVGVSGNKVTLLPKGARQHATMSKHNVRAA